ncbi:1,2-phenylacetyl-CoA epoxidase subunit PaaC [Polluticaenibacter yanchengensis]|uniref:Phenylacetate-CoA oxygenase subunit PaaC n=1 Tax=Polluticaenibacter yanchengensis TaxID=3014562 RepID=A0ABT4UH89_9BACT|nr:phenylacetate-CoA oxygenase subunit PaaC [Chitinophagaceae bacterium LY-5]
MFANDYNDSVNLLLFLADTNLIMSQRLAEWCGKGPTLELDIALTNIALDYLGQGRLFYQQAASEISGVTSEDSLAYFRDADQYLNLQLSELPNGHWGQTVLKVYLLAEWQQIVYSRLLALSDEQFLKKAASKAIKETKYHLQWSSQWMLRLSNGTDESFSKMQQAINHIWPYVHELKQVPSYAENVLSQLQLEEQFSKNVSATLDQTKLVLPAHFVFNAKGMYGIHTEQLSYILAEMQVIQRNHPNLTW